MIRTTKHYVPLLILSLVSIATSAQAKKNRRAGFNFGTGIKIASSNSRTLPGVDNNKNRHVTESTQAFSPFIGLSNGILNLGFKLDISEIEKKEVETLSGLNYENIRDKKTSTKAVSFFTRFLFGKILFMEVGMGIYNENQQVSNVKTNSTGTGNFLGDMEKYSISGSGPGYHMGGGFEISTGGGFYFNGSYLTKIYQINTGESIFGKGNKQAYQQKREIMFGLSHYYN